MASQEDIDQQREFLQMRRTDLDRLLVMCRPYPVGQIPPSLLSGIGSARDEIRHCKATLRGWGVEIQDHPADAPPQQDDGGQDSNAPAGATPGAPPADAPVIGITIGGAHDDTCKPGATDILRSTDSAQPDPAADAHRQHLRELIRAHQSRLRVLELQQAVQGIQTPPQVITEIADIQAAITRTTADLAAATPAVERSTIRQLRQRALTAYYAQEWERAEELLIQLHAASPDARDAQAQLAEAQRQLDLRACYQALCDLRAAENWSAVLIGLDDLARRQPGYPDLDGLRTWAEERKQRGTTQASLAHVPDSTELPVPVPSTPAPARYGPQVIVASNEPEEQETLHGWLLAFYMGLSIGSVVLTINTILWLLRGQALWLTMLSISADVAAWIWLIALIHRQIHRVRVLRAGCTSVEQILEQLRATLDHRWTLYRNLQLPDRTDDLDLILVGPGGVWTVQVEVAPLRFHAGVWEYQRGQRWLRCDPTVQVTRQATALHDFLARNGIERFVEPAVALAAGLPAANVAASSIPVWLPFNIAQHARSLATRYPPTDDELARINDLLRIRAAQQSAVEAAQRKRK